MDLQHGERMIYQGHPSWRAILGFYLKGILIAVVVGIVVNLIDDTGLALLVFAAIVGITVLAGFIKRVATVYTITDRRLNIKRGIVARPEEVVEQVDRATHIVTGLQGEAEART